MTDGDDGLRVRTVALSGVVALAASYLLLRVLLDRGQSLPRNTWVTLIVIGVVAAGVLYAAWTIRDYVRGGGTNGSRAPVAATAKAPPTPQFARGVLVGARASALAGGLIAGFYTAEVFVRVPQANIPTQQSAMWLAAALALASVGLASAGLVAQEWCRIPPEDDDRSPA